MVGSEYYNCRLAVYDITQSKWIDSRILNVKSISYSTKNEVKSIQPMMLRAFSGTLEALLGTPSGKLNYGKGLPPIIIDFSQWSNNFTLNCFYSRTDQNKYQTMMDVNGIFTWVKNVQSVPFYILYIQLFYNDADLTHVPKCALDPKTTVFGSFEGYGYQGEVTSMDISGHDAGKGSVDFTIAFQHGMVVPI